MNMRLHEQICNFMKLKYAARMLLMHHVSADSLLTSCLVLLLNVYICQHIPTYPNKHISAVAPHFLQTPRSGLQPDSIIIFQKKRLPTRLFLFHPSLEF